MMPRSLLRFNRSRATQRDHNVILSRYLSSAQRGGISTINATSQDLSSDQEDDKDDKSTAIAIPSKAKCYLDLAKAKLSALVVTTTAAGFIAAGTPLSEQAGVAAACVVGTALCSSSAAAWNQIFERDRDALMKRTQQRPLVQHHLTVQEASLAASAWGVAGVGLLHFGTDPVTAMLGLSNIGLYAGLYTYMKPRSIYNTWVGAVVGAIPPVMGWTAATGGSLFDLDAMILGTTLYLWQMPHFFALSFMHRVDYKRGGFAMLPVLENDGDKTSQVVMRYAVYLSTVPLVATYMDVTSSMFALEGVALNAYALYVAHKFRQERTNTNARKVFLTSLWYLPSWLVLFLLHSKVWDEEHDRDVLRDAISATVHKIRDQGRQICIHEHAVSKTPVADDAACPVTISRKTSAVVKKAHETVSLELHQQQQQQ